jgi:hypothetical protein
MPINLVLAFLAGEHDFFGVHDNDIITIIDMRGVSRFVLAAQAHGDDGCEPADDEARGIDHHPVLCDLGGFGGEGLHLNGSRDTVLGAALIAPGTPHRQCESEKFLLC